VIDRGFALEVGDKKVVLAVDDEDVDGLESEDEETGDVEFDEGVFMCVLKCVRRISIETCIALQIAQTNINV
jgi:hypothetical protein